MTQKIKRRAIPVSVLPKIKALRNKIMHNTATLDDYKRFNLLLSETGISKEFMLGKLNQYGVMDFSDYYEERHKPREYRNKYVDGLLLGAFMGAAAAAIGFILASKD